MEKNTDIKSEKNDEFSTTSNSIANGGYKLRKAKDNETTDVIRLGNTKKRMYLV